MRIKSQNQFLTLYKSLLCRFSHENTQNRSVRGPIVHAHSFNNISRYIIQRITVNHIEKSYNKKNVKTQWIGLMK